MSMRWHDRKQDDYLETLDEDMNVNWDDEIEKSPNKNIKHQMVKRKLEEKMEKRKIRYEIDDYEQELDEGFDWDNFEK